MSLLWNRFALGRTGLVRSFQCAKQTQACSSIGAQARLLYQRPELVHSPFRAVSVAHFHFSTISSSRNRPTTTTTTAATATTTVTENQAVERVVENDSRIAHQQEAMAKLGILNHRIRETERRRTRRRRMDYGSYFRDAELIPPVRPPNSINVRVKSQYAAKTIDVAKVLTNVFGASSANSPVQHKLGKTSVIVQLPQDGGSENSLPPFVAVFRFGSVVFFNVSPRESDRLLEAIKKFGTECIPAGSERKENFEVVVQKDLEEMAHVVNGDFCVVKSLDMNSVAVISNIMAQTVALDSYNDTVEKLLANFASINTDVTQTGNFTEMKKNSLFRVVAQNNSILIDMISKLGIKDRSDTAWNLSQYEKVHEGMKVEFEINNRFQDIEFKLDMIQQNAKFFLEILHNQKSNTLEWIIIILIMFECLLMCLEMTGLGSVLSDFLPSFPSLTSSPTPAQPTVEEELQK